MATDLEIYLTSTRLSPGSTVEGRVRVSVVGRPKRFHSIVVQIHGQSVYQAEHDYEWGPECSKIFFSTPQKPVWVQSESSADHLTTGHHAFPFSFQLPQALPSSFSDEMYWPGRVGRVRFLVEYKVVAVIQHSQYETSLNFKVKGNDIDLFAHSVPSERVEAEKSVILRSLLCTNSSSVLVRIGVPRGGFSPGESVPVCIKLDNYSRGTLRVSCRLERSVQFGDLNARGLIAVGKTTPIRRAPRVVWEDSSLVVPTNIPPTFRARSNLRLEYFVVVKVQIPWHSSLRVEIPVVIARGCADALEGASVPTARFDLQPQPATARQSPQPQPAAGHHQSPPRTPQSQDVSTAGSTAQPPPYSAAPGSQLHQEEPPAYHSLFSALLQPQQGPRSSSHQDEVPPYRPSSSPTQTEPPPYQPSPSPTPQQAGLPPSQPSPSPTPQQAGLSALDVTAS